MMSRARLITALPALAAIALALALGGCGGATPASSALITDTAARTAASNPVAVSPEPGTPDASGRSTPANSLQYGGIGGWPENQESGRIAAMPSGVRPAIASFSGS